MPVAELERVELPSDAISPSDRADFEAMRSEVYKQTKADDPSRGERLTELADLALFGSDPNHSIHDAVLEARGSDERPKRGISYVFTLDNEGNIVGIDRISHIPEDKEATERARRSATQVPWARKQNRSSFRTRDAKLAPRRVRA